MGKPPKHNVARLRKLLGMSQARFAELVGYSAPTIASIETHRLDLSPAMAARISLETGIDVNWLFEGAASPFRSLNGEPFSEKTYLERRSSIDGLETRDKACLWFSEVLARVSALATKAIGDDTANRKLLELHEWLERLPIGVSADSNHEMLIAPSGHFQFPDPLPMIERFYELAAKASLSEIRKGKNSKKKSVARKPKPKGAR